MQSEKYERVFGMRAHNQSFLFWRSLGQAVIDGAVETSKQSGWIADLHSPAMAPIAKRTRPSSCEIENVEASCLLSEMLHEFTLQWRCERRGRALGAGTTHRSQGPSEQGRHNVMPSTRPRGKPAKCPDRAWAPSRPPVRRHTEPPVAKHVLPSACALTVVHVVPTPSLRWQGLACYTAPA